MARDTKLVFQFSTVATQGAGFAAVAVTTPTGEKANSSGAITLSVASSNGGLGIAGIALASSNPIVAGYRNTTADLTGTYQNWLAGNEVSAIANDPAIWGNTAPGEMFARGVVTWNFASSQALTATNIPYLCVQGAFDNGLGAAADGSYAPISGAYPLLQVLPNVTAVSAAAVVTTAYAHNLQVGDGIVFTTAGGLTAGVAASTVFQVATVPSSTTFTFKTTAGVAVTSTTGTFTGPVVLWRVRGLTAAGNSALFSIPLVESIRPYTRLSVVYPTGQTTGPVLTISRAGLVTGREMAPQD